MGASDEPTIRLDRQHGQMATSVSRWGILKRDSNEPKGHDSIADWLFTCYP